MNNNLKVILYFGIIFLAVVAYTVLFVLYYDEMFLVRDKEPVKINGKNVYYNESGNYTLVEEETFHIKHWYHHEIVVLCVPEWIFIIAAFVLYYKLFKPTRWSK